MRQPLSPKIVNYSLCLALAALGCAANPAWAQDEGKEQSNAEPDEIAFSADQIIYEAPTDVVTASGNVIANRDGYRLRADTIIWDRRSGKVMARGNIRSVGPDGDVA